MRYRLIMPAAGSGLRFGGELPKQYMPLAGRTVIEWALAPFLADARCTQAVIALAPDDARFETLPTSGDARVQCAIGGVQRADSVLSALRSIVADEDEWVLVHDAARPCVSRSEIDALLMAGGAEEIGALLALPLADTLKRADADSRVVDTPSRESLWRALTPQMFRLGLLRQALEAASRAGRSPTDEAQAVEWVGQQPRLVPGSALNLKITTAQDLALAAMVLAQRGVSP